MIEFRDGLLLIDGQVRDVSAYDTEAKLGVITELRTSKKLAAIPHLAKFIMHGEEQMIIAEAREGLAQVARSGCTVDDVLQLLKHNDEDVRRTVLRELGMGLEANPVFIKCLVDLLPDRSTAFRCTVALTLIRIPAGDIAGAFEAIGTGGEQWQQKVISGDPEERAKAVIICTDSGVGDIAQHCVDTHSIVRLAAAIAIYRMIAQQDPPLVSLQGEGRTGFERIPAAVLGLNESWEESPTCQHVLETTRLIVPQLKCLLGDESVDVRQVAARALRFIPDDWATQSLIEALQHKDPGVRVQSLLSLGKSRMLNDSAIRAIASCLRDSAWWVRRGAAIALRSAGPAAGSVLPDLLETLNDKVEEVQVNVVGAITAIKPLSREIVLRLVNMLANSREVTRCYIRMSLTILVPLLARDSSVAKRIFFLSEDDAALAKEVIAILDDSSPSPGVVVH
jgi:hypothetical protein